MPRILIGRTHNLYGKSIWELVGNLKNFGVGRVLVKTKNVNRYPEPSWLRIIKAEPKMDKENRFGSLTVEEVFRGAKLAKPRVMSQCTACTDYQLVPKHMEAEVCKILHEVPPRRKAPASIRKPPCLLILEQQFDPNAANASGEVRAVYRGRDHKKFPVQFNEDNSDLDLATPLHPNAFKWN